MNLLIIPGAADPIQCYSEVYSLLKAYAIQEHYGKIELINYPGHYSFDDHSFAETEAIYSVLDAKIKEFEDYEIVYSVICRSLGCFLFIQYIIEKQPKFSWLNKVIFWGVHPYYLIYRNLVSNYTESTFHEKAIRISRSFFSQIRPFELLINKINTDINYKIIICGGENDDLYPESCRQTLIEINKNSNIFIPKRIKGCGHAVDKKNDDYFNLIFK